MKIKNSVNVLQRKLDTNNSKLLAKSVIKKSFDETTRKLVILLNLEKVPWKSRSERPIEQSGIFCYILLSLFFSETLK